MALRKLKHPLQMKILYFPERFFLQALAVMELVFLASFLPESSSLSGMLTFLPLLVPAVTDFIFSFINGILIEKLPHPSGKLSFWLAFGAIAGGLLLLPVFFIRGNVTAAGVLVLLVLSRFFRSLSEAACLTLPAVLTEDEKERSSLSAASGAGRAWAFCLLILAGFPFVCGLSTGSVLLPAGFPYICLACALLYIVFSLLLAFSTGKEEKAAASAETADPAVKSGTADGKRPSVKDKVKSIFENGPFIGILAADLAYWTIASLSAGFLLFFFRSLPGYLSSLSLFLAVRASGSALSVFLYPVYMKLFGGIKKRVVTVCLVLFAFWNVIFWFGRWNITVFLIGTAVFSLLTGSMHLPFTALYADAASYGKWKTETAAETLVMPLSAMPEKAGRLIVRIVLPAVLAAVHYDPALPAENFTDTFCNSFIILPAILSLAICVIFAVGYRLDEDKVTQMTEEDRKAGKC